MDLNVAIIRNSLITLRPTAIQFVQKFYKEFVTRHPETKDLFDEGRMPNQYKVFFMGLTQIIDQLDKTEQLKYYLRKLGARHVAYGAQAQHFSGAKESLLAALAYSFEEQWTGELASQWQKALQWIVTEIQNGLEVEEKITTLNKSDQPTKPDAQSSNDLLSVASELNELILDPGKKEINLGQHLLSARIVIIDESPSFLAGCKSLILPHVCEVSDFTDAGKALTELPNLNADLVATDLEMVGVNGLELIRTIRENKVFRTIPILAITGKENPEIMVKAIEAGADAFIPKKDIHTHIFPTLLALMRARNQYKQAAKGMQLEAIQALIGTYKHEFGNAITAIEGKLEKLERTIPSLHQDSSFLALQKWSLRLKETLQKLNQIQSYEETHYVNTAKIVKVN